MRYHARFTKEDAMNIIRMYREGYSSTHLAERYNVTPKTIQNRLLGHGEPMRRAVDSVILGRRKGFIAPRVNSQESREKLRAKRMNEQNPHWKGDTVGYAGLHCWIRERKIKPTFCDGCSASPPRDLANISGQYKRDINDFEWLCRRCHMNSDGRNASRDSKGAFVCRTI